MDPKCQQGTLQGTQFYFSPILFDSYINLNTQNINHDLEKSDIFSLGLVFAKINLLLDDVDISNFNVKHG